MLIRVVRIKGFQARTNLSCFRGAKLVENTQGFKPGFTCFDQLICGL